MLADRLSGRGWRVPLMQAEYGRFEVLLQNCIFQDADWRSPERQSNIAEMSMIAYRSLPVLQIWWRLFAYSSKSFCMAAFYQFLRYSSG